VQRPPHLNVGVVEFRSLRFIKIIIPFALFILFYSPLKPSCRDRESLQSPKVWGDSSPCLLPPPSPWSRNVTCFTGIQPRSPLCHAVGLMGNLRPTRKVGPIYKTSQTIVTIPSF